MRAVFEEPLPPADPAAIVPPGTTVLTVNRRLARALRAGHDAACAARGARVWETPDVLPLSAWLERAFDECDEWRATGPPAPARLGADAEQVLWERVIREQGAGGGAPLVDVPAAARGAREALALLRGWRCRERLADEPILTADVDAFHRWLRAFERRARAGGWLDAGAARERVLEAVDARAVRIPARVVTAGFDEWTPQQRALLQALAGAGAEVTSAQRPAGRGRARRLTAPDAAAELEWAARWARDRLERGDRGPVGVVVPDLERRRDVVLRVFEDVLCPGAVIADGAAGVPPFEISLGAPLARAGPVADALLALRLACGRRPLTEASRLLRSPWVGGAGAERGARARFDSWLREGPPEADLTALARRLSAWGPAASGCPRLAAGLGSLARAVAAAPARAGSLGWARQFGEWLALLGWPGDEPLASEAWQAVAAFRELLSTLADLGNVAGALAPGAACGLLGRLALGRVFQPASREVAPVRVLGMLEASGMRFGGLWVCGLDDRAWPPLPRPNPFLPLALQRALAMPHADARRELDFARRVTERLCAAADDLVLCAPGREGDEPLRPSPLILSVPEVAAGEVVRDAAPLYALRLQAAAPVLEAVHDRRGPRLAPRGPVRGGARVLADQAACPFRAYAHWRLDARAPEAPAEGLDPRSRGSLAHDFLSRVWAALGDRAALAALDAPGRRALLEECAEAALAAAGRRDLLRGRFRALEHERLAALGARWLALEEARAPFAVVAREAPCEARIGPLALRLRIDRMDRLAAGETFLVDYKTGEASPSAWFGERPDDPQLPLYALALDAPVAGIAFACLKPGHLGFRGVAARSDLAAGVAPPERLAAARRQGLETWEAVRARWAERLGALAADFAAGVADVDPKVPGQTCRHCDAAPLCRIHEHARAATESPPGDR